MPSSPQLLERESFLEDLLRAAQQGGRVALIAGEAGIGKTSLAQAFAARASTAGVRRILWGGCDPLLTPTPLGPLRDIARQTGDALAKELNAGAPRDTLFAAFTDLLRLRGTAVVVEDVHWADEATLDLLKFAGRRIERTTGLLVITYRDEGLASDHPLRVVLGELPRTATLRLTLPPLTANAVAMLAQEAGRSPAGLHAATDGNPFFVTEALATEADAVPVSVRDAVLARVARLSHAARSVVEIVSIVPGRVERTLVDQIAAPFPAILDECVAAGVLRADADTLRFRHEIARRAVCETLPPGWARTLHLKVFQTLATGPSPADESRLAHHAAAAGDEAGVLRHAPLAARQAAAVGAHREAASHFAATLRYGYRLPPVERAELLESWSYESYVTDQIEPALEARQAALEIWESLGETRRQGICRRWMSRFYWFLGRREEGEASARDAVMLLSQLPPDRELAMAYSTQAQLHALADLGTDALTWGDRAIRLAESLGDQEALAHALTNVGTARWLLGDLAAGRAELERALAIALQHDFHEHVARAYTNLAGAGVTFREYAGTAAPIAAGLAYCEERDLDAWTAYMTGWRARARLEQGEWSEATTDAHQILSRSRVAPVSRIQALLVLGRIRARRGDPGADRALDEARALARGAREIQRVAPMAAARAEAAWLRGRLADVMDEVAAAYEVARLRGNPWDGGELAYWLWKGGVLPAIPVDIAAPFAHLMGGDWRGAADRWAAIGCPYERALALAAGDTRATREALRALEALGATVTIAVVQQEMRARGLRGMPRGPRRATRGNPAGLTRRQLDVLALIMEGLRNAEIAARLGVSTRTADHHVSAVLAKLGVQSRTEAAAAARRLGIET